MSQPKSVYLDLYRSVVQTISRKPLHRTPFGRPEWHNHCDIGKTTGNCRVPEQCPPVVRQPLGESIKRDCDVIDRFGPLQMKADILLIQPQTQISDRCPFFGRKVSRIVLPLSRIPQLGLPLRWANLYIGLEHCLRSGQTKAGHVRLYAGCGLGSPGPPRSSASAPSSTRP